MKRHSRATIPRQRSVEELVVALAELRELRAKAEIGTADRASLDWSLDRTLDELVEARRR